MQHPGVPAGAVGVARGEGAEELGDDIGGALRGVVGVVSLLSQYIVGGGLYPNMRHSLPPRDLRPAFGERDALVRDALGLLGFCVGGGDGFVLDERGDEVAEQRDTVGAVAAEMPVFEFGAGHGEVRASRSGQLVDGRGVVVCGGGGGYPVEVSSRGCVYRGCRGGVGFCC